MDLIKLVMTNKKKLKPDTITIDPVGKGMFKATVVGMNGIQITYLGKSVESLIKDIGETYEIPPNWVLVRKED